MEEQLGYNWIHKNVYGMRVQDVSYINFNVPIPRVRWSTKITDNGTYITYNLRIPEWAKDKEHYDRVIGLSKNRYK